MVLSGSKPRLVLASANGTWVRPISCAYCKMRDWTALCSPGSAIVPFPVSAKSPAKSGIARAAGGSSFENLMETLCYDVISILRHKKSFIWRIYIIAPNKVRASPQSLLFGNFQVELVNLLGSTSSAYWSVDRSSRSPGRTAKCNGRPQPPFHGCILFQPNCLTSNYRKIECTPSPLCAVSVHRLW